MKKKTLLTISLGCRTNQAEINQLANQLTEAGFLTWEKGTNCPDLVIVNTCVVTAKAARETRKEIRHCRRVYPRAFLAVLGCGVDAQEKFKPKLPPADLFVANADKARAAELISRNFSLSPKNQPRFQDKYFLSGRVLVKIQEGCDRFCAYCLVPFLRGKPTSFPPSKIVSQIKSLEKQGIKEVILVGTNLGLYGQDLNPPTTLTRLLEEILEKTKISRVSLSSVEPDLINQKLINLFLKNPRLSSYFHLALQSGSTSVLNRMGRKTNLNKLLNRLTSIKQKKPEFVFRADILVGFPRETEKEFQETLDFIKKAPISFGHVFPYSPRPGTKATIDLNQGKLKDLPNQIKKQRAGKIKTVIAKIRSQEGKKLIGQALPCLFTQQKNSFWKAILPNSWPVKVFSPEKNLTGKIREITITQAETSLLIGQS